MAVVEIGAGTTGLLVFAGGAVKHTAVLAVGGNHVSSDIAAGLRTPFRDAELLKRRFGAALSSAVPAEDMVEVPTVGGRAPRELSRRILAEIVEPRLDEIFALVQRQLIRCGLETALASGIVLTGGSVDDGRRRRRSPSASSICRCASARRYVAEGIDDTLREPRLCRRGRSDPLRRPAARAISPDWSTTATSSIACADAWLSGSES